MEHQRTEAETIRQAAREDRLLVAGELGVSAAALARAEGAGDVVRLGPGVYLGAGQRLGPLSSGAAWAVRHPTAVVGLLSAAVFHDLTDAFPRGTWLLVPKGTSPPRSRVAAVHALQVAPGSVAPEEDEENGIVVVEVHAVRVRVTGPDRTVIDLWRYPRRIPAEYALDALRRRGAAEGFHLPALARLARQLGAWGRMEAVVQGMMLR